MEPLRFQKITHGFVVQTFDVHGKCIDQEFIAGDEVEYETLDKVDDIEEVMGDFYFPFLMVQPEEK